MDSAVPVKRIAVLGSTGSLGTQTLDVARAFPGHIRIVGLAAGWNRDLLERQIGECHPRLVAFAGNGLAPGDFQRLTATEMAAHPEVDLVVVLTSGQAGLEPTLAALEAGKPVALANKEVLVIAGDIVMAQARDCNTPLVPVDSEHSALWQCLQGEATSDVARLVLTASGVPFRGLSPSELAAVDATRALAHPTWNMGPKVTVDSATLMNKGMEVIEAHHLFGLPYDDISVMVHPQSIVHSIIEFVDGSMKAQLSAPDMRLPIQYALSYPQRWPGPGWGRLRLEEAAHLTFEPPDDVRFPCLRLAVEAGRAGGTTPTVLSAADEVAVARFLENRLGFTGIPRLIEAVLSRHSPIPDPTLEQIMEADTWARQIAEEEASR
jgi:1-deoxy-D-xylulose-5-phosphate reductoisomerase